MFLVISSNAFAEDLITVRHYSLEEGMSGRYVQVMIQDSLGFIWMGTKSGLHRFDGHQFKIWVKEKGGLPANDIFRLKNGPDPEWIWFSTADAQSGVVNIYSGEIRSAQEHLALEYGHKESITHSLIFYHQDERLFLICDNGEVLQFLSGNQLKILARNPKFGKLSGLCADAEGGIWVHHGDSVMELAADGQVQRTLPTRGLLSLFQDSAGAICNLQLLKSSTDLSTGFYRLKAGAPPTFFNPGKQFSKGHGVIGPSNTSHFLLKGGKGILSASTLHLSLENLHSGKTIDLLTLLREESAFSNVLSVLEDRTGTVWIGTSDGLFAIVIQPNKFRRYLGKREDGTIFSVRAIWVGQGKLLASTYQGIQVVEMGPSEENPFELSEIPKGLVFRRIQERKNGLWMGGVCLNTLNEVEGFNSVMCSEVLFPFINDWYFGKEDRCWLATQMGLYFFDPRDSTISSFELNGFNNVQFSQLSKLNDGNLLAAGNRGLFLVNEKWEVLQSFGLDSRHTHQLPGDDIYYVYPESDSIAWLGTNGSGLIRLNIQTGIFRQFTMKDGLSNNTVYTVYPDDHGQLWLTSNYGLMRFNKSSHLVQSFLPEDGIAHEEFNFGSHFRDEDGRFYFGGLNGITSFHPDDFADKSEVNPSKLLITEMEKLDGETGAYVSFPFRYRANTVIDLYPNDKLFRVALALPDYADPDEHIFAYRILGFDDQWRFQKTPTLELLGLPPGRYQLEITGRPQGTLTEGAPITLTLFVHAPFYQQGWFLITLGLIMVLAIIAWAYRVRRNRARLETIIEDRTQQIRQDKELIEKQAGELRELDEAKTRFFTNVSHELRTPLTLILGVQGQLNKALANVPQLKPKLDVLGKSSQNLKQYVDQILDLSKLDQGPLVVFPEPVELRPFIERSTALYQSRAVQQDIRFILQNQLPENIWVEQDIDKFEKIINNLVGNALKFTPSGGRVEISSLLMNGRIVIRVKDTGPGIPKAEQEKVFEYYYQADEMKSHAKGGTGIGLAMAREYAQLLEGTLTVNSEQGQGAIFTLDIPARICDPPASESTIFEEEITPRIEFNQVGTSPVENGSVEKPHILVVEDHPEMREYLRELLSPNYTVKTARNGQEAIAILEDQDQSIQLIVSDQMMPVMTGLELLHEVQSSDEWAGLPFIMVTAVAGDDARLRALRTGVDDYVTKPFREEELLIRVAKLLERSAARKIIEVEEETVSENSATHELTPGEKGEEGPTPEAFEWLRQLEQKILEYMDDNRFSLAFLADLEEVSERHLRRKIKSVAGLTPKAYITEIKLNKARRLLESGQLDNPEQVLKQVGFSTPAYFAGIYRDRFGKSPADYF